jgi:hypothetical protein
MGFVLTMYVSVTLAHAATIFTVNSVTATPAAVQPGQTVRFATTVTANATASDYTIGLQVFLDNTVLTYLAGPPSKLFTGLTFQAYKPITQTSSWTIPAGTTPGKYELLAGVFDSNWNWQTGEAVYFTVQAGTVQESEVTGACGASNGADLTSAPTSGLCSSGTASMVSGSGPWSWSCAGTGGGSSASCLALLLTNGSCGGANGVAASQAPTSGLCNSGIASAVAGAGPWSWSCAGSNGGATASCLAPLAAQKTNGACGSANGAGYTNTPTANLCSTGTASAVSGSGPWSWGCAGSGGGSTALCAASLAVNGACGTANGVAVGGAPGSGLCRTGTASAVTGSGPWNWSCAGSGGGTSASCEAPSTAPDPQKPGPSAQLFNNPYYTCVTNYYVAPNGNDSNNGTSSSTPWLTLQHANNALPTGGKAAGSCINVAPGTYSGAVSLTAGGNLASSTGYVVYRCTTMDACTITYPGKVFCAGLNCSGVYPNYLIVDGFTFSASSETSYAFAFGCYNGDTGKVSSGCHHWWFINNVVSGYGQGGVGLNDSEFFYTSHNTIYNNAHQCNGIYGSGIGYVTPKVVSGYTKTADDTNANNLAALNLMGVQGTSFPFNNVVAWNTVYNNWQGCGPPPSTGYTDGNGIIMDSFGTGNGNPVAYTNPSLVAFNVSYNNGGGGVHIFYSEDVTAANNTCYNNGIDPNGVGSGGACIDTNDSYSDTIINNIAVAIPAAPKGSCTFGALPYAQFNSAILGGPPSGDAADTFSNNITQLQGGHNSCWGSFGQDAPTGENPMWNADTYSCSSNKCATNPLWVNVGNSSTGSETTQPSGANFALQAGSPAIGYGLTKTFLPAQSTDAGACYHTLSSCP